MEYQTIKFEERESGIGLLTLNRPDKLNALNLEMLAELSDLFGELNQQTKIRVIVLTAAGRGFCSGADLTAGITDRLIPKGVPIYLVEGQKQFSRVILEMKKLNQPVIAAVNGVAAGAGMALALASDILYASSKAKFIPSFVNIGLSGAEMGISYFLPRIVGYQRAAEIMMTGKTVHAEEADKIGMVCKVVEEEALLETAMETARSMLQKSLHGLWMTKEALNSNLDAPNLKAAIDLEDRNQTILAFGSDFLEAVSRFSQENKKNNK